MNGRSLIIFACWLAVTLAAPTETEDDLARAKRQSQPIPPKFNFQPPPPNPNDKRFELQGGGGGSRSQGFDVNAAARVKVWESQNGLNQVHGTGSYGQHLGGPYGNSRPSYGGGISYTRRF